MNVVGDAAIDDRLFVTNDATINTLTVGLGSGDIANNNAVGYQALQSNTTGKENSAFGYQALKSNTEGQGNMAIGWGTLFTNDDGDYNCAIGRATLYNNQSGEQNMAIGKSSLFNNTTGDYNTAIGSSSLLNNTTTSNNTAIGYQALLGNTGSGNTAIGRNAGSTNTSGANNVYLGNATGGSTFSHSAAIGYNAQITKSDQIVLGKDDATPPEVYIPGYLGIGTTTPLTALDVSGADAIGIPCGNDTSDRPTGGNVRVGQLRYNNISHTFEGYQGESGSEEWAELGGGGAFQLDGTTAFYNEGNVKIDGAIQSGGLQETNHQLVFSGTDLADNNTQYELAAINTFYRANNATTTGNPGGLVFKTKAPSLGLITQMTIDGNGKVRIGDASGDFATYGEKFLVNGETYFTGRGTFGNYQDTYSQTALRLRVYGLVNASEYDALSDKRLKTNILPITDALAVINKINGYNYTWKNDKSNKPQTGLIAQEVEDVIPHIVNTADKECPEGFKPKAINYNGVLPYLIESIKTLTNENNMLNEKINSLETDNANVKSALSTCEHKLEKQNELIEKILKKLEL